MHKFGIITIDQLQTLLIIINSLLFFFYQLWVRAAFNLHRLRISKYSFEICPILSFDIFSFSDISINFNLRASKISLWTFFLLFSSVTAYLGRPLRVLSSMLISPRLNLLNHSSTVDISGEESSLGFKSFFFRQKAVLY